MAKHGVLGINFDHMHMGDLLRAGRRASRRRDRRHLRPRPRPHAVGDRQFRHSRRTASSPTSKPAWPRPAADLAIVCSATARARRHRRGDRAARPQRHGREALRRKRRRRAADDRGDGSEPAGALAINWPLAWYPSHNTAKRLIDEGAIGELIEVHFYDGNRGPLFHLADKVEVSPEEVERQKPGSWWYKQAAGGGSLLDYLGYGTTLGTWFMGGEAPLEVTCVVDETPGIEVDQHSITVCRYARGLSKFETRWGTLTDPWTQQPQPKCGFVLVGTRRHDRELRLRRLRHAADPRGDPAPVQVPVDALPPGRRGPVEYMLARHRRRRADRRSARPGALR